MIVAIIVNNSGPKFNIVIREIKQQDAEECLNLCTTFEDVQKLSCQPSTGPKYYTHFIVLFYCVLTMYRVCSSFLYSYSAI